MSKSRRKTNPGKLILHVDYARELSVQTCGVAGTRLSSAAKLLGTMLTMKRAFGLIQTMYNLVQVLPIYLQSIHHC